MFELFPWFGPPEAELRHRLGVGELPGGMSEGRVGRKRRVTISVSEEAVLWTSGHDVLEAQGNHRKHRRGLLKAAFTHQPLLVQGSSWEHYWALLSCLTSSYAPEQACKLRRRGTSPNS